MHGARSGLGVYFVTTVLHWVLTWLMANLDLGVVAKNDDAELWETDYL